MTECLLCTQGCMRLKCCLVDSFIYFHSAVIHWVLRCSYYCAQGKGCNGRQDWQSGCLQFCWFRWRGRTGWPDSLHERCSKQLRYVRLLPKERKTHEAYYDQGHFLENARLKPVPKEGNWFEESIYSTSQCSKEKKRFMEGDSVHGVERRLGKGWRVFLPLSLVSP